MSGLVSLAVVLPPSATYAAWLAACLGGAATPDQLHRALGEDPLHVVVGLGSDALTPVLALGPLRAAGAAGAAPALPVPGDPVGLAGPPAFNAAALEAGEAVLLPGSGLGLVPTAAGDVVTWRALPAERPRPLDPAEEGSALRVALAEATQALVELDVARWRPEIADVLGDLRHRPGPRLPPLPGRLAETVERAALCLEVVALAREDDGAAVSAYEIAARRAALDPLDRAARRALVAALGG